MGGVAIRVKRGPEPHWYKMAKDAADGDTFAQSSLHEMGVHQSEWDWVNMRVDYTVENNGTIDELKTTVQQIVKEIKP